MAHNPTAELQSVSLIDVKTRQWPRSCCLDVEHATSSAFKHIKVWQAAKSRPYTGEPHGLTAS
jgi:hypothetical protein